MTKILNYNKQKFIFVIPFKVTLCTLQLFSCLINVYLLAFKRLFQTKKRKKTSKAGGCDRYDLAAAVTAC